MIKSETHEDVVVISLDRAEKRNAMLPEMLDQLVGAIGAAHDARAIALVGEGKVFCAGFDLKVCAADSSGQTMRDLLSGLSRVVVTMRSTRAPIVLGVHGAAVAGGCALLGGADVVLADRNAKLGYPVVKIGVSPAVSSPFMLASITPGRVRNRLVDPDLIDAQRALRIGLVHELVDDAHEVRERTIDLTKHLACKPGQGIFSTKRWLHEITAPMTDQAQAGLDASLSLTGGNEEHTMLGALWA